MSLPEIRGEGSGEGLGGDVLKAGHHPVQLHQRLLVGELRNPGDVHACRIRP